MELVKFKNGKYGVRRRTLFGGYRFLSSNYNWWPKEKAHQYTLEHSKEGAEQLLDIGEPV